MGCIFPMIYGELCVRGRDSKEGGLSLRTISGGSQDYLCFSGDLIPPRALCPLVSCRYAHLIQRNLTHLNLNASAYKRNALVSHTSRLKVLVLVCNGRTISKITTCLSDIGATQFCFRNLWSCKMYHDLK